jgi:3-phosphoshikimate 1-carboxyvinyltransferase
MIQIEFGGGEIVGQVNLPSSKSESNRALIIQALSGGLVKPDNLSDARDTQTLISILKSRERIVDVKDAGTTMRFLTAFFCILNENRLITGSARMCERPILPLVEALKELGFIIRYVGKEGYPPIEIIPANKEKLRSVVSIRGDMSSQFISALLMIAPCMPRGLILNLEGEISSRPYIEMTLHILERAGIKYLWQGRQIQIQAQKYSPAFFHVEADWSGASYWYSIAALSGKAELVLKGLKKDSLQGDKIIAGLMECFGVSTVFTPEGAVLRKTGNLCVPEVIDFSACPDLCQTIAVLCGALNVNVKLTGVKSLRIKETDRLAALQAELSSFGISLVQEGEDLFKLSGNYKHTEKPIKTYEDHRMAMAFAPLSIKGKLSIENPEVVVKSFPKFWSELEKKGFKIQNVQ